MAQRHRSNANLAAGTFLLVGLVGFFVISMLIAGTFDRLHRTHAYTVRFALSQNTNGIQPGTSVMMGGQPVGRVSSVGFAKDGDFTQGVDVGIKINAKTTIYSDAEFVLERPLVGAGATLNIISVGSVASGELEPGSTLRAGLAVPAFLEASGFGPEQIKQVQRMISQTGDVIERIDTITNRLDDDLDVMSANLKEFTESMAEVDAGRLTTNADQAITDMRALIAESQEMVRVNRPRIDDTLATVQRLSARFEDEAADDLIETIHSAREAADNLADLADNADALLAENSPSIERSLANARLASDQLRLATIEIRRNPWRLLSRPKTKELREELVYDAARIYAAAASDLRDAGASLESVLARGTTDEEEIKKLQDNMKSALESYKQSEERLLDLLFE
ncbi:MAG TPA: MCE family protein [Phycisphaerales bacterium]|nr:MCE family protein [Phycisphaerales bacterium]